MNRSIGTPLALFGLLLAAAMVCTTSAQGPKPESPAVDPSAPPSVRVGGDESAPVPPAASTATPADDLFAPRNPASDPFADPTAPPPAQRRGDASSPFVPRDASSADPLAPRGRRGASKTSSGGPPAVIPTRSGPTMAGTPSGRATPLVVGRYQAVSHNGRLILLDTATGECYAHERSGWRTFAPPIEPNGILAPRGPATAPELPVPGGVSSTN
jgi:hypothetical protein